MRSLESARIALVLARFFERMTKKPQPHQGCTSNLKQIIHALTPFRHSLSAQFQFDALPPPSDASGRVCHLRAYHIGVRGCMASRLTASGLIMHHAKGALPARAGRALSTASAVQARQGLLQLLRLRTNEEKPINQAHRHDTSHLIKIGILFPSL